MTPVDPLGYLQTNVAKLVLATALGMFLGLEREWSHKSAGIRTSALISLAFVVFPLLPAETVDPWGAVQPRLI